MVDIYGMVLGVLGGLVSLFMERGLFISLALFGLSLAGLCLLFSAFAFLYIL